MSPAIKQTVFTFFIYFQANAHFAQNSCCWDQDGCNANLTLEFPESSIFDVTGADGVTSQRSFPLMILMILLPIVILSVFIALAYLVWHRYG